MTYNNIDDQLEFLYGLNRKGIKLGLGPIKAILDFLGNPQNNYKSIHIAGTNGKGSTAIHLYRLLIEYGYKVGIYTSPHLVKFNERIRVNGIAILDKEIISFMHKINIPLSSIDLTFFEVTTAMALDYFNNKNVDIAIIETGLGGRLDSTNIINPYLSIITPISMDHMNILGDTIEKIAYEKAGIIKKNVPLITSKQTKSVFEILKKKVFEKKTNIIHSKEPRLIDISINGTSFSLSNTKFITPLTGKYQADNAALAISAIRYLIPKISNYTIKRALSNVKWGGRLQRVSKQFYYDVSHNESGINVTIQTLKELYPNSKIHGLFCIKGDKNLNRISDIMKTQFDFLLVTASRNGLLMNPNQLSKKLKRLGLKNNAIGSVKSGIKTMRKTMRINDVGLIFGSHYIADEVFTEFEISFDSEYI